MRALRGVPRRMTPAVEFDATLDEYRARAFRTLADRDAFAQAARDLAGRGGS